MNNDSNNTSNNDINILSFNANGLAEQRKRIDVFDHLRQKKHNIIMLQETHWMTESENIIRNDWGFDVILNGTATNKNGVAILFRNNFEYTIHKVIRGNNGSYLIIDISFLKKRVTLVNVYGPSGNDSPLFYENLFNEIETLENDEIITAGDWNVTLNEHLDTFRYQGLNHRANARNKILEKMERLNIVDIWRNMHPTQRQYTWRKFNSTKRGRLDFFLISESLIPCIDNTEIRPGYRSDHSVISLTIKGHVQLRDKPLWKFNNSLLKDITYAQAVKETILSVKKQYSALVYDSNNIHNVDNENLQLLIDDQLFFEVLLMEIRGKTISYASYKKKERNRYEKRLTEEITYLETNLNEINVHSLEEKKAELENIRNKTVDGIIVRSKAHNIEEGEKNSKFFSSLEKRNYIDKSVFLLEREDKSITTEPTQIKEETELFYKNLYSSKERDIINVDLNTIIPEAPKLSDEERESLEGKITYKEASNALNRMQNDKSPGSSGYTNAFFKFFWKDIGHFLVRSINEGFKKGRLSVTQRQGVIICIPKEGKDKRFLSNWRPITLLNTSYKIASACIAARIKHVLPSIIHGDQTGFLAGRYIGENVRLIYDVLYHTEKYSIPGQILLIDFLKAFDSVSWSFIEKCLDFFNFGEMLKTWFKTFYSDLTSCVSVNGGYTKWFQIQRGCRQGDPVSPYIFLICAEILSLLIRNNKDIKGIKINQDLMILLSQFADDTSLFLDGTRKSFEAAINTLQFFASISGLNMNLEKTQVVWIGSKKNSDVQYMPNLKFKWNPKTFKALGVTFSTELDTIVDINYEGKLHEIKRIFNTWSRRHLTPYGKITIIKSFAIAKIVYFFINIPDPDSTFLKALDKMMFDFLWDNKPSKINRLTACSAYNKGGLNMIDLYSFIASMKISWIKRMFDSNKNTPTSKLFRAIFPKSDILSKMGGNYVDALIHENQNPFWKDVFKHYKSFYPKCLPTNTKEFEEECIHFNTNITRGGNTLQLKKWLRSNIFHVKDITNINNGRLLTFEEFTNIYPNIGTDFVTYNGIISAISRYKQKLSLEVLNNAPGEVPKAWTTLRLKQNKSVYNVLTHTNNKPKSLDKWVTILGRDVNWAVIFYNTSKIEDKKLRWFEMKILHRILPTQKLLHSMRLAESPHCNHCENEIETITHLFWECPYVRSFWNNLTRWITDKCPHQAGLQLTCFSIISLEINGIDHILRLIVVLAKYHIFNCKISKTKPSIQSFKNILTHRYVVEKYRCQINSSYTENMFNELWGKYTPLL